VPPCGVLGEAPGDVLCYILRVKEVIDGIVVSEFRNGALRTFGVISI